MKIKNNGERDITFSDLKIPACGTGRSILQIGKEALVYNEDAEKSKILAFLLTSGEVLNIGSQEPSNVLPVDAVKSTLIAIPDSGITTEVDAVDAKDAYTKADIQGIVDLVNDLKSKYNDVVYLINEAKSKLNEMNA